jgi:hypothetical protein
MKPSAVVQTAYNWFTEVVSRSRRRLRDPRYLLFAVPGAILWGLSLAYWGQGRGSAKSYDVARVT